jgi:hypothetical protein
MNWRTESDVCSNCGAPHRRDASGVGPKVKIIDLNSTVDPSFVKGSGRAAADRTMKRGTLPDDKGDCRCP